MFSRKITQLCNEIKQFNIKVSKSFEYYCSMIAILHTHQDIIQFLKHVKLTFEHLSYTCTCGFLYITSVHVMTIMMFTSTMISYQCLFLKSILLCYCTDASHMYTDGDIKPHRKDMGMIHCSDDHNIRQDTLEM